MKQMEVTKKKIGDNTFYIRPFPAFTAANISGELSSVMAPIIGGLAGLMDGRDADELMDMDLTEAVPSITEALGSIDGDKVEHLMQRLLITYKNVSVAGVATDGENVPLDMDIANEIFCGEIDEMILLCAEVVKVNYGGFFKKVADRSGGLQELIQKKKTTVSLNGASST